MCASVAQYLERRHVYSVSQCIIINVPSRFVLTNYCRRVSCTHTRTHVESANVNEEGDGDGTEETYKNGRC